MSLLLQPFGFLGQETRVLSDLVCLNLTFSLRLSSRRMASGSECHDDPQGGGAPSEPKVNPNREVEFLG